MRVISLFIGLILCINTSLACTSVIISGQRTASGRAIMLKNRDTDALDNRLERYTINGMSFIGLVNAEVKSGEVWAGINEKGFAIMNTAVYNFDEDSTTASYKNQINILKRDSCQFAQEIEKYTKISARKYKKQIKALQVKQQSTCEAIVSTQELLEQWNKTIQENPELGKHKGAVDKEGEVMFKALAVCTTVKDFLKFLDTLPKPMGVEANFGVIDNEGGALYVETNSWRYVVFDVNNEPNGYRVQTNFAFSGCEEDYSGYERYLTTCANMRELDEQFKGQKIDIQPDWIFNHICRSYRHEILGMKEKECPASGIVADQDFVPRRSTSASIVFDGPVMWSILGYPACGVAIPAMVCDQDRLPNCVKDNGINGKCSISNIAMGLKKKYIFPTLISNGQRYVHIGTILKGKDGKRPMLECAQAGDQEIKQKFEEIFVPWQQGKINDATFYEQYEKIGAEFENIYKNAYQEYLQF